MNFGRSSVQAVASKRIDNNDVNNVNKTNLKREISIFILVPFNVKSSWLQWNFFAGNADLLHRVVARRDVYLRSCPLQYVFLIVFALFSLLKRSKTYWRPYKRHFYGHIYLVSLTCLINENVQWRF